MWDVLGEVHFSPKYVFYEFESRRQSMERKDTDSPVKKKFRAQQSVKKIMMAVFWDMKGPVIIDFLEGTIVHCPSDCQFVRQNSPYLLNVCLFGISN